MLIYSAPTAKAYRILHKTEVMTSNQKEQFCRVFKKYAIEQYKRTGRKFDGRTRMLSRNVFSVTL